MRVAVLGAGGTIAPAIVRDLAESEEVTEMRLLDIDLSRAEAVAMEHGGGKAEARRADATADLTEQLAGMDVLVNSAHYPVNLAAMEACLEAGCDYMDLGGLYHVTAKQLEFSSRFEQGGRIAILGAGSAPGKTNLMAARAVHELGGEAESISVAAAGRDLDPPGGMAFPYAVRTLIAEISRPPMALIDGQPRELEPMEAGPRVDFGDPIGEAETIFTLHSEVLTFGDSFGAEHVTFALSLSPQVLELLQELAEASEERVAEAARLSQPALAQYRLRAHRRRDRGREDGARRERHSGKSGLAARGRRDLNRFGCRGRCAPAGAWRDQGHGRVAARALHRSRPDVQRARDARRALRVLRAPERGGEMKVGVPTEIKEDEYRVSLTPAGARELTDRGHEVLIQAGAGEGSSIPDEAYTSQGARIVPDAAAVFEQAEMILGVKEPQPGEVEMLHPEHTLFTFLHLAPAPELTRGLQESGATCVAYETVEDAQGRLPLLAPMSEVAGKIATQAGAFFLEKPLGGRGILLGGVPGVAAATVMVIGGGAVGMNAAFIAIGMEADVFVLDVSTDKLRELDVAFGGRASTVFSSTLAVEEMLPRADLVIGAVLVHGAKAPYVVRREQLELMKGHAVLVDVAIDQGGCFETSHPTTHRDPVFEVEGITHYCVANMPGAVPITSTYALTNATLPYVLALADHGVTEAARRDPGLRLGINVAGGTVTHPAVAEAVGVGHTPVEDVLGSKQRV